MEEEKTRIIIIEDNKLISLELKILVEKMGYEVISLITSGEEGVKQVLNLTPDLVLMDIKLSEQMDGIEAAEIIHSKTDIPIIFITAYSDTTSFNRLINAGACDFIAKPFDNVELLIKIEAVLMEYRKKKSSRNKGDIIL
jgi:hypothetical protein